jgi:hypothetical protein
MRFLKVTTFYPSYLRQFYGRHPFLAAAPYAEQQRRLFHDGFGWADYFQNALGPLGYEAREQVINAEPLQRAWAVERGVPMPDRDWMLELAFEQVRRFNPEVLFLDDINTFPRAWIERVRAGSSGLRLVLGWSGAPSAAWEALPAYDAILSCVPELVDELRGGGARAFHLHHGFDPRILERIRTGTSPTIDLSFVGQLVPGSGFHAERERMLVRLAELFDIRVHAPAVSPPLRSLVKRRLAPALRTVASVLDQAIASPGLRNLLPLPPASSPKYELPRELPEPLRRRLRSPVFGLEMFQLLRDSRATFNCHIGASRRSASNQRLFEATGAGTCLVTDLKDNLHELFVIDEEVVAYRSLDECVEKIRWLLANPARSAEIGRKGQARTLRDHNFSQRAIRLDALIRELLNGRP